MLKLNHSIHVNKGSKPNDEVEQMRRQAAALANMVDHSAKIRNASYVQPERPAETGADQPVAEAAKPTLG